MNFNAETDIVLLFSNYCYNIKVNNPHTITGRTLVDIPGLPYCPSNEIILKSCFFKLSFHILPPSDFELYLGVWLMDMEGNYRLTEKYILNSNKTQFPEIDAPKSLIFSDFDKCAIKTTYERFDKKLAYIGLFGKSETLPDIVIEGYLSATFSYEI